MLSTFDIISNYNQELYSGLKVTLQICSLVYLIGTILGVLIGIARHTWKKSFGILGYIGSLVISSTPILVLLFWLHYPLQYMLKIVVDPFITSVVALIVVMMVLVSEQVRHALDDFPKQYLFSARVCGLSNRQIALQIQLPMIFRLMLPNLLFAMITILQASLFASMIGVNELFRVAQQINSEIYQPVQIYGALAIFFICICAVLNIVAFWLRTRLKWSLSDI